VIRQVLAVIKKMPDEIVGCKVSYEEAWARKSVAFNAMVVDTVEAAVKECGYPYLKMHSGRATTPVRGGHPAHGDDLCAQRGRPQPLRAGIHPWRIAPEA
jgi:hypothetical protein